jgi:hypothetical protein
VKKKQEVPLSSIEERTACICLFFSAHLCRPCRSFTPTLLQAYTALRSAGKSVEIIFMSLDRDEASFRDHFQGMPWLAVPFDAAGLLRQKLCARFAIERIPSVSVSDAVQRAGMWRGRGEAGWRVWSRCVPVQCAEEEGAGEHGRCQERRPVSGASWLRGERLCHQCR